MCAWCVCVCAWCVCVRGVCVVCVYVCVSMCEWYVHTLGVGVSKYMRQSRSRVEVHEAVASRVDG